MKIPSSSKVFKILRNSSNLFLLLKSFPAELFRKRANEVFSFALETNKDLESGKQAGWESKKAQKRFDWHEKQIKREAMSSVRFSKL